MRPTIVAAFAVLIPCMAPFIFNWRFKQFIHSGFAQAAAPDLAPERKNAAAEPVSMPLLTEE